MSETGKEYGEGNYKASRQYNEATKKFVESGKVEEAARDAAPNSDSEASQMADAEAEGRSRAKEEDPALLRGADNKPDTRDSRVGSPSERSPEQKRSSQQTKIPLPRSDKE